MKMEYGAIAQRALRDQLVGARLILLIVGVVTCGVHCARLVKLPDYVDKEIRQEIHSAGQDTIFDYHDLAVIHEEAIRLGNWVHGLGVATGAVIFLLGIFLYKVPVIAVVTSLMLYTIWFLVDAYYDLESLQKMGIMRFGIIILMAMAARTAFAYRKELRITQGKAIRVLPDINAIG